MHPTCRNSAVVFAGTVQLSCRTGVAKLPVIFTKELDDNNPSKNDRKDPKVIAGLVKDGRYFRPYIPDGVYAEIKVLSGLQALAQSETTRLKNRVA